MIVIAASRGGIKAVGDILATLPEDFPVPIAIVQHRTMDLPNLLAQVLARRTKLEVRIAEVGEKLKAGTVYVAPPHAHLLVTNRHTLDLTDGSRIHFLRSSANPLFSSAARAFDGRLIAVVLTGGDRDATDGVQSVHHAGGMVIAQDRATSEDYSMPKSAIDTGCVDRVLSLDEIGPTLLSLVSERGVNRQEINDLQ
jgi:two-component system chemotaxis response regulator CheB